MLKSALEAAEASSELFYNESADDKALYVGVLYFSRAAEALESSISDVRLDFESLMKEKSDGKNEAVAVVDRHDLYGEMNRKGAQLNRS